MRWNVHSRMIGSRRDQDFRVQGFTLIELLVVISIIALLVGILLPALGAARRSAMVMKCMSREKQLLIAQTTYAGDNDGHYAGGWTSTPNNTSEETVSYDDLLAGYDGRSSLTEAQMNVPYLYMDANGAVGADFYLCPMDEGIFVDDMWGEFGQSIFRRTYAVNRGVPTGVPNAWRPGAPGLASVWTNTGGNNALGDPEQGSWSAKDADVTIPSSTILLLEFSWYTNVMGIALYGCVGPEQGTRLASWGGYTSNPIGHHEDAGLIENDEERQQAKTNYGFADGHVENLSFTDTLLDVEDAGKAPNWFLKTMWDHKQ